MKRSRYFKVLLLVVSLAVLTLAGCGQRAGQAPEATATPVEMTPTEEEATPTATAEETPTSEPSPEPAAWAQAELIEALQDAGATVELGQTTRQPFFDVEAQLLQVNGAQVLSFEFADEDERAAAADIVSDDGRAIGSFAPSWVTEAALWARGRVIVLYIGEDADTQELLTDVLEAPIARYDPAIAAASPSPEAIDWTQDDLVEALRNAGATVEVGQATSQPFFDVEAQLLQVNGAQVLSFEFSDNAEQEAAADIVSDDGRAIGSFAPNWVTRAALWARGRVIVLYVGEDAGTHELLTDVLEEPIARYNPAAETEEPEAVQEARHMLATELDVPMEEIQVVSEESETWPDACLGLADPDEVCAQVETSGWQVVFAVQRMFELRTNESGSNVRWQVMESDEVVETPTPEAVPPEAVSMGQERLASALDVDVADIEILAMEEQEWPNACLGLAQEGEMCAEVLTPGWSATVQVTQTFVSHVSEDGSIIRWQEPLQPGGDRGEGVPPEAARLAEQELAATLDVLPAAVEVVQAEQVTWSDSCLGLGKPNESCAQVTTPGWRVVLAAESVYEIRANSAGSVIRWQQAEPDTAVSPLDRTPPEVATQAQEELANSLGVPARDVVLLEIEEETWPDACLGLPAEDEACAEVMTPGWRIIAAVEQEYVARTDETGDRIRWESDLGEEARTIDEAEIYLIALEDAGDRGPEIGCGDSLISVTVPILPTQSPIEATLRELLSIETRTYGEEELYNALYMSDLQVENVEVDDQGRATVRLTGDYSLGGACDTPRFQAQLTQTILQFDWVEEARIILNDMPMEEALSARGGEGEGSRGTGNQVDLYFVALGDGGERGPQIGCGDSLVPVTVQLSSDPSIEAALQELLSIDDRTYGEQGLYNALRMSDLQVESVEVDDQDTATVRLTGGYSVGGACDTPRFENQLTRTVLQFESVEDVEILLNDTPIGEALSAKG